MNISHTDNWNQIWCMEWADNWNWTPQTLKVQKINLPKFHRKILVEQAEQMFVGECGNENRCSHCWKIFTKLEDVGYFSMVKL